MCLIIHNPKAKAVSHSLLVNAIMDNPHGWGIMAPMGDRIKIEKGMEAEAFCEALDRFEDVPHAIHFRYATHGTKDVTNAHPFPICKGKYALMHNGVLDVPSRDHSKSDTWHFAKDVLTPILSCQPKLFGTDYLTQLLENLIGAYNKLVIMRGDGATMIVNEDCGTNHEGLWLSNRNSLSPKAWGSGFVANKALPTTPIAEGGWGMPGDAPTKAADKGVETLDDYRERPYAHYQDDEVGLVDLAEMHYDELADVCQTDPYGVAEAIQNFFEDRGKFEH